MMAAKLAPGAVLSAGRPRVLFEYDEDELSFTCSPLRCYDVAPDGESFYATQPIPPPPLPPVTHIHVALNWLEEVKARFASPSP